MDEPSAGKLAEVGEAKIEAVQLKLAFVKTLRFRFPFENGRDPQRHISAMPHLRWLIVDDVNASPLKFYVSGKPAMTRMKTCQAEAPAVVSVLLALWEQKLPKLSRKSKLAEASRYALTRRASLERFTSDGRVEFDFNTFERVIRPQTIIRKNSLLAGSDGGRRI